MNRAVQRALFATLVFVMAGATSAFATPVNWTLSAIFADGATATGSFTYDADMALYSAQDINTTVGTLPAFHYTAANSFVGLDNTTMVDFVENGLTQYIRLAFSSPLTNAGGTIALDLSESYECSNCATIRRFVSGSVTSSAVPEPVSLTLLGIGLASIVAVKKLL